MRIFYCMAVFTIIDSSNGVTTRMDFGGDEATFEVTNSSDTGDNDVEVKHTIVLSTKLKNNNNRKGVRSNDDGDSGTLTYKPGQSSKKEDSGEVPIVNGYKAVDSTRIRTPDSRHKAAKIYPDSVFVNRNIRDDYDVYPNAAPHPSQWKPSNFFNNINWLSPDGRAHYDDRHPRPYYYQNPQKINRKISDEAVREFYCGKCIELSNEIGRDFNGCSGNAPIVKQRSANSWSPKITTPVKLDGKLAKLN